MRSVHTPILTVDVTTTGPVDDSELQLPKHDTVALRSTEDAAVTGDPTLALEVSRTGDTWIEIGSVTGTELSLIREAPEAKARLNVTTAADAGSLTAWLAGQ